MTPGKRRYSLLPPRALALVVDTLTYGAGKHGDQGWTTANPQDYLDALYRHLAAYHEGEWLDGSGFPHLAHVGANALILLALEIRDQE